MATAVVLGIAGSLPALAEDGSRQDVWAQPPIVIAQAKPAPAAPQRPAPPKRTEILNFENWTVTCSEFSEGPNKKPVCYSQLRVMQEKTRKVMLVWTVGLDKSNRAVAEMQTPTGILIEPGVELKFPNAAARKLPFNTCGPQSCTAMVPLDPTLVRDLIAAPTADVAFRANNGQNVQFQFPVKGFEKAYAALRK
jgi:invasion protein IalB